MNRIPDLRGSEFALVDFRLEMYEPIALALPDLLQLRRNLRGAARRALPEEGPDAPFTVLFDPPVSTDPTAVKKFQRPGPAFVIRIGPETQGVFEAGDYFDLRVLFWGRGISHIAAFGRALAALGTRGLVCGEGRYELAAMRALDLTGNATPFWQRGERLENIAPILLDLSWWLSESDFSPPVVRVNFVTPARLISRGRPLFQPHFRTLFPFILRRVTSMIHAHCDRELVTDAADLLRSAGEVREEENRLQWTDWRRLEGEEKDQEIGGITGSLLLSGSAIDDILWVLQIGSLLQLGKGAAFGAGRYDLEPASLS